MVEPLDIGFLENNPVRNPGNMSGFIFSLSRNERFRQKQGKNVEIKKLLFEQRPFSTKFPTKCREKIVLLGQRKFEFKQVAAVGLRQKGSLDFPRPLKYNFSPLRLQQIISNRQLSVKLPS